jgi:hypothetical protein
MRQFGGKNVVTPDIEISTKLHILCHNTIWCWYPFDRHFVTTPSDTDTRLIRREKQELLRYTFPTFPSFVNFSYYYLRLSLPHLSPLVSVVLSVRPSVSVRLGIFQDPWEQSPGICSVPWRLSGILNKHPAAHQAVNADRNPEANDSNVQTVSKSRIHLHQTATCRQICTADMPLYGHNRSCSMPLGTAPSTEQ